MGSQRQPFGGSPAWAWPGRWLSGRPRSQMSAECGRDGVFDAAEVGSRPVPAACRASLRAWLKRMAGQGPASRATGRSQREACLPDHPGPPFLASSAETAADSPTTQIGQRVSVAPRNRASCHGRCNDLPEAASQRQAQEVRMFEPCCDRVRYPVGLTQPSRWNLQRGGRSRART